MNPLKKWYDKLSPKGKQYVLYGGLIVGLGVVVLIFMDAPKQEIHHQTTSKTVFTDSSVKKLSDDAMESEVRSLKQQNNDLKKDLEYLHTQMTRGAGKDATLDDLDRLRLEMKTELAKQAEESRQRQYLDNAQAKTAAKPAPSPDDADDADAGDSDTSPAPAYARPSTGASPTTTSGAPPANNAPSSSGIRIIGSVAPAASPATVTPAVAGKTAAPAATPRNGASGEGVKGSNSADADEVFIPAGSMIRGILLSGMDAPTSKNARQDPYPALIRITDDAILPNLNRADVKECFVIAAGYGDLSSERLMLRGTTLSCVTDAGGVIEVSLKAYAVGEDGKVGLRGRLINKQSSLIARAMLAGFMQSFSELFKKNPVPVIASTATDTTQFQSVLSSASLQGAAAQGASSAMQRLAQYYIDLADAIHPVIEVDAGRTVDLVISTGIGFAALSNS